MSVPVTISDVHAGLSEAAGTLRLTDDFLILELQVTVAGLFKQRPLAIKIAAPAIHSVRYRRGLLRDHVYIRPWKSALLASVPGKHDGEVHLKVKRDHRAEAEALVDQILDWVEARPA